MSPLFCHPGGLLIGSTLIVSDLHLEKGTRAVIRQGGFIPPYDTRASLSAVAMLIQTHRPKRLVFLGDTFDDVGGLKRLSDEDRRALNDMIQYREVIWVLGNHDPLPQGVLPGLITQEFETDGYLFRHEADPAHKGPMIEVSGHFHPVAKVQVRGTVLRRACFVEAGHRLILPALGAYTGGLNVLTPAFAPLELGAFVVHVLGHDKVYTLPMECLVA